MSFFGHRFFFFSQYVFSSLSWYLITYIMVLSLFGLSFDLSIVTTFLLGTVGWLKKRYPLKSVSYTHLTLPTTPYV